ncbi:MAG: transcription elongation factor GreA [Parcubacteria group bacterium CG1_02_40_82]|uniref:Transcription elongation factor GreA n=3 Tax=Candidatus Portnoyibacteriota TaxID=1817913 RepID=A0A2M7YMK4_9BACT|nr:MAG: transcription elongation factor GreA [Parcubacteria group bacterium CG1_02_40_82]PIQ75050.1 MAG: transcription elongation factor GreA [Candidatus Portnoybacteria bacterium CG11_big_fil_rev_8_21_14_0_20_40_15]PIS31681.1 MAG: transcription elongation factor GreA [Candidatus Portnoybacteria bacterium CG08_land_8_20_14_0_20_40_83]PIY74951.1 MAG: transcription elongation factor GreA [Candidatus Portnoybacteria bacterium CG_4_10_14_0_8_um_filter_40_50]PJA64213.1 MAG: transcription elongation 
MKYLSKEGLEQIKKEVDELKLKRQEIAQRLEESKALGDLSENMEYLQAKEAQAFNEGKILELEEVLKNAVVINKNGGNSIVQIGGTVEINCQGEKQTFTIVGSEEANPAEGKISNESPLGKAFLGHKAGETVEVETPKGKATYKIISIK